MKATSNFYIVSKSLDKEFRGEYILLRQLIEYIEAYSMWSAYKKLQNDGSFFCSDCFIAKKLGLSRPTVIKNKKDLEKRGFLKTYTQNKGGATYILLNLEKIDQIQNETYNESIDNYNINDNNQEKEEPAVAKNETADEPAPPPALKDQETKIIEVKDDYSARIMEAWNKVAEINGLAKIILLKEERIKKFKAVIKYLNISEKDFFNSINSALKESKFLRGYGQKWRADFDFFLSKQKALKAIEGGYRDNTNELIEKLSDVQTISNREAQDLREKMLIEKYRKQDKERREAKQEAKSLPS